MFKTQSLVSLAFWCLETTESSKCCSAEFCLHLCNKTLSHIFRTLEREEKLADHLFMYLTTQSVYVKIRREIYLREWKPSWQSYGWLTKIVCSFLWVIYSSILGERINLSKRIERAFRYSKFLLSYEIYLKYTNWKLFEVHLLLFFFFFVLTDINNANTLFIKIGSVLYAYIKSGTSHLLICFMLLTTLWENEMSFLQSVDAKLRQTSNNCPGNIHSECKNQNMGSLPSDHLSNVLTCCTILSLKYWSVVVSSVTTNRR